MYGSSLIAFAGFAEEIMPGLDFIPTASIAWYMKYGKDIIASGDWSARADVREVD